MVTVSKVYINIDFQKIEVMPLLHGTIQLYTQLYISSYLTCGASQWHLKHRSSTLNDRINENHKEAIHV